MSEFQISNLKCNEQLQSWAQKCDVNGDGTIDKAEILIFQQGKESMETDNNGKTTVTVGGLTTDLENVKSWKKSDENSVFDYSLRLSNGVKCNYSTQPEESDAQISEAKITNNDTTFTFLKNFTEDNGVEIIGNNKTKDIITIANSKISKVDGLGKDDTVLLGECIGNHNTESAPIIAENIDFFKSDTSTFQVSSSSKKRVYGQAKKGSPTVSISDNLNPHKPLPAIEGKIPDIEGI